MTDSLTKAQRSYVMSRIRNKWTKPEKTVHNYLKGQKIRHKMHPPIEGSPDIILTESSTAIFIHGCFWHKCFKCYTEPSSNRSYWIPKMKRNVARDRHNAKVLLKKGWKVRKIWEHEIREELERALNKLTNYD